MNPQTDKTAMVHQAITEINKRDEVIEDLKSKLDLAVGALKYYSNHSNWDDDAWEEEDSHVILMGNKAGWKVAEKTLAQIAGEKEGKE